jgi:hypothetical protein
MQVLFDFAQGRLSAPLKYASLGMTAIPTIGMKALGDEVS